jgi:hypothetical protein
MHVPVVGPVSNGGTDVSGGGPASNAPVSSTLVSGGGMVVVVSSGGVLESIDVKPVSVVGVDESVVGATPVSTFFGGSPQSATWSSCAVAQPISDNAATSKAERTTSRVAAKPDPAIDVSRACVLLLCCCAWR